MNFSIFWNASTLSRFVFVIFLLVVRGIQTDNYYGDVISRVTDFVPYLCRNSHYFLCCHIDVILLVKWIYNIHYLIVLQILPNTIWGNNYIFVWRLYFMNLQLRLGMSSSLYPRLVSKRSSHGKARHLYFLHPNS